MNSPFRSLAATDLSVPARSAVDHGGLRVSSRGALCQVMLAQTDGGAQSTSQLNLR